MLWQMVIVAVLILLSAGYLGWQSFKTWSYQGWLWRWLPLFQQEASSRGNSTDQ